MSKEGSFIDGALGGEALSKRSFIEVDEVATDLGVSKSCAYKVVRTLNNELEGKGYLTVSGRVSRRFYEERFYADAQLQKCEELHDL